MKYANISDIPTYPSANRLNLGDATLHSYGPWVTAKPECVMALLPGFIMLEESLKKAVQEQLAGTT